MSFRTILVPIEQHDLTSSTLETALCLAQKFDSYIEGFALRVANPAAYAMAEATAVTTSKWEQDIDDVEMGKSIYERRSMKPRIVTGEPSRLIQSD
jgi:hypothetical protein